MYKRQVDHRDVRLVLAERGQQLLPVLHRGDNLALVQRQHVAEPVPQQRLVLGDHDSHGIRFLFVLSC